MATRTLATLGTGAVTDTNQTPFRIKAKHFNNGMKPMLSVNGLAGAETADLYIKTGTAWSKVGYSDSTNTPVTFDVDEFVYVVEAPGIYGLVKSSTAGAITVAINDGR